MPELIVGELRSVAKKKAVMASTKIPAIPASKSPIGAWVGRMLPKRGVGGVAGASGEVGVGVEDQLGRGVTGEVGGVWGWSWGFGRIGLRLSSNSIGLVVSGCNS